MNLLLNTTAQFRETRRVTESDQGTSKYRRVRTGLHGPFPHPLEQQCPVTHMGFGIVEKIIPDHDGGQLRPDRRRPAGLADGIQPLRSIAFAQLLEGG